jgi:glycosyltransferase involved in cell wall biosynthesis
MRRAGRASRKRERAELVWGPVPIINNKYWSNALAAAGWQSKTLVEGYYPAINKRADYDLYFADVVPRWARPIALHPALRRYFALLYVIRHAKVIHLPFSGGPLGRTRLWRLEAHLLRLASIRTVLISYGSDAYRYSTVVDASLRHALLSSYPQAARQESFISARVRYWQRHADVALGGFLLDGVGRWDVTTPQLVCVDVEQWHLKPAFSPHNGVTGVVKVIHTPNHRGYKGTEFLIHAVKELQAEGLAVELVLLEKTSNDRVRELTQEADILAEQFIFTGYALSGVEGMASGLAVMANLEDEAATRVFRRYSFLNECPVVSTSPETIKRNLTVLVTNPALREQLGWAGRQYVEKYHSYESAQFLFGSIYDKILDGRDVDLINLFHPLKSTYNRRRPLVEHPLTENQLPAPLVERALSVAAEAAASASGMHACSATELTP